MMRREGAAVGIVVACAAAALLVGCGRLDVNMTTSLNADGSGHRHIEMSGTGILQGLLQAAAKSGKGGITSRPGAAQIRWEDDIEFANVQQLAAAMPARGSVGEEAARDFSADALPAPPRISFQRERHFVYTIFYYQETYAPQRSDLRADTCPMCHGKRYVPCLGCDGTGRDNCPRCKGTGWETCPECKGTGINPAARQASASETPPSLNFVSALTMPGRITSSNGERSGPSEVTWRLGLSEMQPGITLTAVSRRIEYPFLALALLFPLPGGIALLLIVRAGRRARSASPAPAGRAAEQPPQPDSSAQPPSEGPSSHQPPPPTAPPAPLAPPPALDFGPPAGREPVEVTRAKKLFAEGRFQEAATAATDATHFYPEDPRAWTAVAAVNIALDRLDLAEAAARRAVQLAPDQAAMRFNLGVVLRAAGMLKEALAAQRQCLALGPTHEGCAAELALLEQARRDSAPDEDTEGRTNAG